MVPDATESPYATGANAANNSSLPHCISAPCQFVASSISWLELQIKVLTPDFIKDPLYYLNQRLIDLFTSIHIGLSAMWATVQALLSFGPIGVRKLATEDDQRIYQARVAALEQKAEYPLGEKERFKIDHGQDYFAFFKRLGEMHYYVAQEEERVVGVAAGVLRTIPYKDGEAPQKAWYICDLKIDPEYRGRHIPIHMFTSAALNAFTCRRGYAISMNPANGQNRIVKMFSRHSWIPVAPPVTLYLFSMNAQEMRQHADLLAAHRGPVSYLSLQGTKDLVLQSTQKPLPLLHAQFGPCQAENPTHAEPQEGYTHMFCAPENDPLYLALASQRVPHAATASILSSGMEGTDWRFILTSDI